MGANKSFLCTEHVVRLKTEKSSDTMPSDFGSDKFGVRYEPDTSEPITVPVESLDELLLWMSGEDEFNVAMQPLAKRTEIGDKPLTLVCHDLMGGYTDDRFVQGVPKIDCYRFYHWQYVDLFVYFSHHFVSIPPPGWTNAAHRHGVLMLGTLITEWKDGTIICKEILKSEESFKAVADKLVDIAVYYNFDGWLINIENAIEPQHISRLIDFVRYLMESIHRAIPGSKIIWYDSVIQDGSLKWQDMLNHQNRNFFDGSDGIFLNYTWTAWKLDESVINSGNRKQDVFVGVDVFGRNCYGGGGWNTYKAMKVIQDKQLSAAIFAPGWVYETLPKENFIANQNRFWESQLASYLQSHGVTSLPFLSNFCRGYGKMSYRFGKPITCKQWCNQSAQQVQPTLNNVEFAAGSKQSLVYTIEDAYEGGGCIELQGEFNSYNDDAQLFRIFKTDIELKEPLLISLTTKINSATGGCLVLCLSDISKIVLWPEIDERTATEQVVTSAGVHQSAALPSSHLPPALRQGQEDLRVFGALVGSDHKALLDVVCGGTHTMATMDASGWTQQYYLLSDPTLIASGLKIKSISIACYAIQQPLVSPSYSLRVGDIKICDPSEMRQSSQQVTGISYSDISWHSAPRAVENSESLMTLCATLKWNFEGRADHYDLFCSGVTTDPNKPGTIPSTDIVFVGRAYNKCYRICHLVVGDTPPPPQEYAITFYIQPTSLAGMTAPYDTMSRIKLICQELGRKL